MNGRTAGAAALLLALCILFAVFPAPAFADREEPWPGLTEAEGPGDVKVYVDGMLRYRGLRRSGAVYLPLYAVERMCGMRFETEWQQRKQIMTLRTEELTVTGRQGDGFLLANGRYVYTPGDFVCFGETLFFPLAAFERIFQVSAETDAEGERVYLQLGGMALFEDGDSFYRDRIRSMNIYWLSRIISAESYHEPMAGMIAVGQVVLNRVESPDFPKTVKDVIYESSGDVWQFTPAKSGAVLGIPSDRAVAAAYMCYDGYDFVGDALFFVNPKLGNDTWFGDRLRYIATVGSHAFYGYPLTEENA